MNIKEISLRIAEVGIVEFEDGRNTIGVITKGPFRSNLSDAVHWAAALTSLMEVAVNSVEEKYQNEFEKRLLEMFLQANSTREQSIINPEIEDIEEV